MPYTPGNEPAELKKYINYMLRELHTTYPDGLVVMDLWDHERWDKVAGYLVKSLGYPNGRSFLNAYGFEVFDGKKTTQKTVTQNTDSPQENNTDDDLETNDRRETKNKTQKRSTSKKSSISDIEEHKAKWVTAKLILGIISMVLFILITFQSCAAGLGNALLNNGEISGSFGFLSALNLLISGIIAVAARKSNKKLPWIISAVLLFLNLFYAKVFGGSYSDLEIWGYISFAIGLFYLLSCVHTIKGYIIVAVISAVFLAFTLAVSPSIAFEGGSTSTSEIKKPTSVTSEGQTTQEKQSDTASVQNTSPTSSSVSINETEIFNQNGIKVTAKDFTKGTFGPGINLLIENDSNKSITVQARDASVNGYMVETMMSSDVAAGKKVNDTLTFSNSDLNAAGITTVADMEFSLHIFDPSSWETVVDSAPIKINTSVASSYTYSYDDSGNQAYNGNGVEVVVKGLSEGGSWLGPAVVVYINNTSGQNITVQAKDVSVNGFMVDPFFSSEIISGKHAIDTITFSSSELEKNGISTINDIELSFHIFNTSTWETIVDTSPVKVSFN